MPELTVVLDALENQLADRERQLTVLESLMSTAPARPAHPAGRPAGDRRLDFLAFRLPFGSVHRAQRLPFGRRLRGGAGQPGDRHRSRGRVVRRLQDRLWQRRGNHASDRLRHPLWPQLRNLVHEGDPVQKGQAIAIIGSTGRSTGTHVHFEVERNGKPVNPTRYMGA